MRSKNEIRFYVDVDLKKFSNIEEAREKLKQLPGVLYVNTAREIETARATEDYIRTL